MSDIIVLGAGMVGSAMAIYLSSKHRVTLTDVNAAVLEEVGIKYPSLHCRVLDVTDKTALTSAIKPFDLVICAVPGFLVYHTLHAIILAGKNLVDISFFPYRVLELD